MREKVFKIYSLEYIQSIGDKKKSLYTISPFYKDKNEKISFPSKEEAEKYINEEIGKEYDYLILMVQEVYFKSI